MTEVVFSTSTGTLTIPATPGGAYWLDEDGLILPEVDHRVAYADDSPHVAGALATQAVQTLGTLGVTVYTKATDLATLKTQQDALADVVRQFSYTATVTLHGTDVYTCLPGRLSWGTADSGMVAGLIAKGVLTIPTQPLES